MKFYHEPNTPAKIGDTRCKRYFAIFPVRAGNETRWLENVCVIQEYKRIGWDNGEMSGSYPEWENTSFAN